MTTDIQALISQMTLEEKAALCTGASAWITTPMERLGIPELIVSDGPHGVRRVPDVHSMGMKSLPATCFPTASCLASTWDVELMRQMGHCSSRRIYCPQCGCVAWPRHQMDMFNDMPLVRVLMFQKSE